MAKRKRTIKVVLLVGGRDFGRCPIATQQPTALWSVFGEPALQRVLKNLAGQDVAEVVVCSDDDISILRRSVSVPHGISVRFLDEDLPLGTAGCVRRAAGGDLESLWVVMRAAMVHPPDIETLVRAHTEGQTDLTLVLKSEKERSTETELADIYLIEPKAIEYIPDEGFFDIKEGLIPALAQAGNTIRTAHLSHVTGAFRDRAEYLAAMSGYLHDGWDLQGDMIRQVGNRVGNLWVSGSARIDASARLYGPVVLMSNVNVQSGAVVFGPTVIESGVTIGSDSFVENSVFWSGAAIGSSCEVRNCIVGRAVVIEAGSQLEDIGLASEQRDREKLIKAEPYQDDPPVRRMKHHVPTRETVQDEFHWTKRVALAASFSLLLAGLIWAYWPVLSGVWHVWLSSAEYSAGIIVPFLAVYVLWARRREIHRVRTKPSMWGLAAFVLSQAVMIFGIFYMYGSAVRISFILSLAALVLLLFGWGILRKIAPVLLFICLMFPFPQRVHDSIVVPAQRFSMNSAAFCLQSMGIFAATTGNTLRVDQTDLTVDVECSGLPMVTAFMIIGAVVALLVRRRLWEKLLVFASSIPIAMLCNTVRITLVAMAAGVFAQGAGLHEIFHDTAGYAMMPLALATVVIELWLLSKLVPATGQSPVNRKISMIWEST